MITAREQKFGGDYSEVKEYYAELRKLLYTKTTQEFGQFTAAPINQNDCAVADSWFQLEPKRRNDWRWTSEYFGYQKLFKRFDIAFKQKGNLVGLSYGVATAHNTGLKINLIESTPFSDHKLGIKGFELISYAAQVYAAMLGADEIRLMKPTSPGVRSYYCSWGYEYIDQSHKPSLPDYCVLRLR